MKPSFSPFVDESKIQSYFVGNPSKKNKEKSRVEFISPKNKLQDIFGKNEVIEKNESLVKKHAEKKKNMTCINLGVDEDYLDLETTEMNNHGLKIVSTEINVRSERKKIRDQNSKKEEPRKRYKINHHKSQSQGQQRFSVLEPNKEKENLIKFEKKLMTNLVKKKEDKNVIKSNFNEAFRHFYDTSNQFSRKEFHEQPLLGTTLSIKKETFHEFSPVEINNKKKEDENKTMASSKITIKKEKSKHQLNLNRQNFFNEKEEPLKYKKLSESRLKNNMTEMLFLESEIQEQVSFNKTVDEVSKSKTTSQHKSSPNILVKNYDVKERNEKIEKNKIKAVEQNLKLKKFDLNKLKSAIHRSANVSTHIKFVPYNKKMTTHESLPNSRGFLKCRNTCPISQTPKQSIFTPWDYLPSEKEIPDCN